MEDMEKTQTHLVSISYNISLFFPSTPVCHSVLVAVSCIFSTLFANEGHIHQQECVLKALPGI